MLFRPGVFPRAPAATSPPRGAQAAAPGRGDLRAAVLAALVTLAAALPGLLALPPLDRDEARFAQSTAQMLESGDFVDIRYRDEPRDKKPVGVNWLQALSVTLVSSVERREIWAYRLPSLAGAMIAAAACAWGASRFLGRRGGVWAGVLLGASFILSSEAFIAKTDALLCAGVTVSMAAFAHLYARARAGEPSGGGERLTVAAFWAGQALAIMVKGPIGPMVAALTMTALWAADGRAPWARRMGWGWGLIALLAVAGPWAMAITVSTDGTFWSRAVGGDLAPKLAGGHETHGMPPGYHLLLSPVVLFPGSVLLPAALVWGWRHRRETVARLALAWLAPAWLVFEAAPTKLVHYTLPLLGAVAWLAAGALTRPIGRWSRAIGAVLSLVVGVGLAGVVVALDLRFGGPGGAAWAAVGAGLSVAAGVAGAWAAARGEGAAGPGDQGLSARALGLTLGLGVLAHVVLTAGLAPRLQGLWLSQRAAELVSRTGLDPRNGVTPGPVAVAGYAEPSLVFLLGDDTELDNGAQAAEALAYGQPALVESRQAAGFLAALRRGGVAARAVGRVSGFDYSDHKAMTLTLWRTAPPARAVSAASDAGATGAPPTRR